MGVITNKSFKEIAKHLGPKYIGPLPEWMEPIIDEYITQIETPSPIQILMDKIEKQNNKTNAAKIKFNWKEDPNEKKTEA